MNQKVTKKQLEEALETYANLVEMYPDNEAYLKRYAQMLKTMGREATAITTLQRLHDVIAKRSEKEANAFAKEHPEIGRLQASDIIFDAQDKHAIAGKIIYELLGSIWLRLHRKKLSEGQSVCHCTDLNDTLILVIEGKVDAYIVGPKSEHIHVETISALDVLGEHTIFKPGTMGIDAFAASPKVTIAEIPRNKVLDMMASNAYLKSLLSKRAIFRTNLHAISGNSVFQVLPMKLCQHLARGLVLRHYDASSMIYTLDQTPNGVDIILRGEACYLAKDRSGKKIMLPPLPVSSLIGDITLRGKDYFNIAELMSRTKTTIAHIPYADVLNVSVAFPPLKERLIQHADMQQTRLMQALSKIQ